MFWRSAIIHPNCPDPGIIACLEGLCTCGLMTHGAFLPLSRTRPLLGTELPAFRLLADPLKHPSAVLFPAVSSRRAFSHAEDHAVITAPSLTPLVKIVVTDALPGANGSARHR